MNKAIRTFREFIKVYPATFHTYSDVPCACRFCRKSLNEAGGLWKYSTRHYVCNECLAPKLDDVLPSVKRRERFNKKMDNLQRKSKVCPVCQDSACEIMNRSCGK